MILFLEKLFGIYLFLFMILGGIAGRVGNGFSKDNKTTTVLMVCGFTVLFDVMFLVFSKLIYNYEIDAIYSVVTTIKETLYNIIFAYIFFKPLSLLGEIINKSKNSYYLL